MRLPEVLGALGALVVGAVLAVFLLTTALGEQPALPSLAPPSLPPLPTLAVVSHPPSASPSGAPLASQTPVVGLAVGDKAPPLEVTLLDGSIMNTEDFAGTPIWINFMATWCPQCRDELPMMADYAHQLKDSMNILVVDVGEDRQTVKTFMKSLSFDLPVGVDDDGSVQRSWGTYALPVHYWLDEQGIVRDIVYGGAPPEVFIQAITDVVPEFSTESPQPSVIIPAPEDTPTPTPNPGA
jgi:cytochrome c biogenesis protein CcmG/thiol:disulfide interchange protein DsbE